LNKSSIEESSIARPEIAACGSVHDTAWSALGKGPGGVPSEMAGTSLASLRFRRCHVHTEPQHHGRTRGGHDITCAEPHLTVYYRPAPGNARGQVRDRPLVSSCLGACHWGLSSLPPRQTLFSFVFSYSATAWSQTPPTPPKCRERGKPELASLDATGPIILLRCGLGSFVLPLLMSRNIEILHNGTPPAISSLSHFDVTFVSLRALPTSGVEPAQTMR
jgi:hypothetical protein